MERPGFLPVFPKAEEPLGSTPVFVLEWLKNVEVGVTERTLHLTTPDKTPQQRPVTPDKTLSSHLGTNDDISPTTTKFSSIFDEPDGQHAYDPTSPRANGEYADSVISTLTTLDEAWKPCLGGAEDQVSNVIAPSSAPDQDGDASLNSYDPPTEIATVETPSDRQSGVLSPVIYDPGKSRMVWITSCLQCMLKGLHCSRTPPACSRCIREGSGNVCLLHRRRLAGEQEDNQRLCYTTPLLLRTSDDTESIWEMKVALFQQLYESWILAQERKNWVLPLNDGKKGHFGNRGRVNLQQNLHPGEGIGQNTYRLLTLA